MQMFANRSIAINDIEEHNIHLFYDPWTIFLSTLFARGINYKLNIENV